jgi:hypothetical protein
VLFGDYYSNAAVAFAHNKTVEETANASDLIAKLANNAENDV